MGKFFSISILTAVAFMCHGFLMTGHAQVTVAPTALFIDDQSNMGNFLVLNNSGEAQEVTVEFEYGYPATDSLGNTYIEYEDSLTAEEYAAEEWMRPFPRSFVLEPGERQTVRVSVRPQPDMPDRTYFTRIVTTSNPQTPEIDPELEEDEIAARIDLQFEQVTAAFYRHGDTYTGVEVRGIRSENSGDELNVYVDAERTGNSPFLGSMQVELLDENGEFVAENRNSTTVYFEALRSMSFNKTELPGGPLTARVSFENERPDVSPDNLPPMDAPVVVEQALEF